METRNLKNQYKDSTNLNARIRLHVLYGTNKYSWQRWIFDHFEFPESAKILELGCGQGNLWLENADRIPPKWNITLSDFSKGMVENVKKNLSKINRKFNFAIIDAQSIPYPNQSFDAVVANHMLYHLPDREKVLSEIKRILKPNGYLYATTVGENHMKELKRLLEKSGVEINKVFDTTNFTLENGTGQLSKYFKVNSYKYENVLRVTEVKPLIDYILSTDTVINKKLEEFAMQEIKQKGLIIITNSQGIFVAQK